MDLVVQLCSLQRANNITVSIISIRIDHHNYFLILFLFLFIGGGIYILYEDVKSCSCEDVHALWTLLVDSDANFT